MQEDKKNVKLTHNLILKERKSLNVSGVLDVDSFDDSTVVAYTDMGELTVKGRDLHVSKINLDSGDLVLDGEISLLEYTDNNQVEKGFFSRLFR